MSSRSVITQDSQSVFASGQNFRLNTNATVIKNLPTEKFDELQHELMSNTVGQQETNLNDSTVPDEHPCHPNPCKNGGICSVRGNNFSCECSGKYFGNNCERKCECENGKCRLTESAKEVCDCYPEYGIYYENFCKACDCGDWINCTFHRGLFTDDMICLCPDGKKLRNTKCPDPCSENPCKNGGTCRVEKDTFQCDCPTSYSGMTCEKDPCSESPCLNGGTCRVEKNTFQCDCPISYSGATCEKDPCSEHPCLNGGLCIVAGDSFLCNCRTSYYGILCEKGPCSENPCLNGGECEMSGDSFLCKCPNAFSGIICEKEHIDPCSENPCLNGGECVVSGDSFLCKCPTPYSGITCEKDPCSEHPCLNGGECIVFGDSFLCKCPTPYSGITCEKDPCSEHPCLNGGECVVSGDSFLCKCPTPYSGITCEKDPCSEHPCLNGGECVVSDDSFLCKCPTPYSGITCEKATCYRDEDCTNGTICTSMEKGKRLCQCPPNFRGEMCEINVLCESLYRKCEEMGAVCVVRDLKAYCECPPGKQLDLRSIQCKDICDPRKCVHGKCEVVELDYKCRCDEGYVGVHCEEKVKTLSKNSVRWLIVFISVNTIVCLLLFGIFCLLFCRRK
ncbi:neurogenic locus notch 1 [Trichonephila inaurata madagascariensis]|uniref:Neurogenic locus notch 1 n=1 Tax=Trichonephila inaurata madagascariensis TaxID=2747483 RepID=A0A8X6YTT2_9ARAC|nr:neurogenic locus notch 1 [Trichonephila inaurata madagascariensis]